MSNETILRNAMQRIAIRASHLKEVHPEEIEFSTFYQIAHDAYYSSDKTNWKTTVYGTLCMVIGFIVGRFL